MKTRRLRLGVGQVEATTGWANAALVVRRYHGNVRREAVISIESPYDMHAIRAALDKIETYWASTLTRAKT